jgi:molybdate transport system substrate-binding protein
LVIYPDLWFEDPAPGREPQPFGRNPAVMVVPSGNPQDITELGDFSEGSGLPVKVCGQRTSYGPLILLLMFVRGVTPDLATFNDECENDAAEEVANSALQGALMYRAGLRAPDGVEVIEVDEKDNFVFDVSSVALSDTPEAESFASFLQTEMAQTILEENGYLP